MMPHIILFREVAGVAYYYPIPLIGNFLIFLQWFLIANSLFERRFSRAVTWLGELAAFGLNIFLGSVLPYMSMIRALYLPVLFFLAFRVLFRDKWYSMAFLTAALYLLMLLTELLSANFIYTPEILAGGWNSQPVYVQFRIYTVLVIVSGMLNGSLYLLIRGKRLRMAPKELMLCAAFLLCQVFCMFCYIRELCLTPHYDTAAYITVGILSTLVLDGFLIHYVITANRRQRLQSENALLAQQISAQSCRYGEITAEYEAVRRMRHDIAKHLTAMEALLQKGRTEEASRYITELRRNTYVEDTAICENPVADALLCSYRERSARQGTPLELRVQLPAHTGIADTDLVCGLGNLLDNALEACAGQRDAGITLSCACVKGFVVISLENPVGTPRPEDPKRGVGTRILNHLADKYHGSYRAGAEGELFRARLTLEAKEEGL